MIAEELGYTFADADIVKRIALEANVSPHWVETVEKEAGGKLSRIVSKMVSKPLVERILKDERGYIDEEMYLDYLILIIAQIADEGNVVILGRGSQYILDDHPDAYHILLINDAEKRAKFMMEHYDLSRSKAEQVINREDKRRMNLYRKLGKSDYDDSSLYHLVLNMGKISLERAKKLACSLLAD
jgi:cytidylate kinase